jgi:hypothetical protein
MISEGRVLIGTLKKSEDLYYIQHTLYYETPGFPAAVNEDSQLGVDVRSNKYFTSYFIGADNSPSYTAFTNGTGDAAGTQCKVSGVPMGITWEITDNGEVLLNEERHWW